MARHRHALEPKWNRSGVPFRVKVLLALYGP